MSHCVQVLILGTLVAAPWLIGGVTGWSQRILAATIALSLLGWFLVKPTGRKWRTAIPMAAVPLFAAVLLASLQQVPLKSQWLQKIAPQSAQWWQQAQQLRHAAIGQTVAAGSGPFPISIEPTATRHELCVLLLAVAMFVLCARFFADRKSAQLFCMVMAINGAALTFFALVQQFWWNGKLFWSISLTQGGSPFGPFVNRNNSAGFLILTLACGIGLLAFCWAKNREESSGYYDAMQESGWLFRLQRALTGALVRINGSVAFALFIAVMIAAGIASSKSRGGLVAMSAAGVVTFAAVLIATKRWSLIVPVTLGLACTAGLLLWLGRSHEIQARLTSISEVAPTEDVRFKHWQTSWKAFLANPIAGSGLGAYGYAYRPFQSDSQQGWFQHAENQFVEAAVTGGVVALVLLLAAIISVSLAVRRVFQDSVRRRELALGLVGVFALTGTVVASCFDFGLYIPANMLLFAAVCGICCGRAMRLDLETKTSSLHSMGAAPWLCAVTVLALLVGTVVGARHFDLRASAESLMTRARVLESQDNYRAADLTEILSEGEELASRTGELPDLLRQLGLLRMHRFRQRFALSLMRDMPKLSPESAWQQATVPQVLFTVSKLKDAKRLDELQEFLTRAEIREDLARARQHFQRTHAASPLRDDTAIQLAGLDYLFEQRKEVAVDMIAHACRLAPWRAWTHKEAGVLELALGRTDAAFASWNRSLELSPDYFPEIVSLASAKNPLSVVVEKILPNRPDYLIHVATRQLHFSRGKLMRELLLDRAQTLLETDHALAESERLFLQGTIANLQHDPAKAAEFLQLAVEKSPDHLDWRFQLSQSLLDAGRVKEAYEQATICVRQDSQNPQYQAFWVEVNERYVLEQ